MTKEQDCNCGIGGSPGERHDVACHRYASTSSKTVSHDWLKRLYIELVNLATAPNGTTFPSWILNGKEFGELRRISQELPDETQQAASKTVTEIVRRIDLLLESGDEVASLTPNEWLRIKGAIGAVETSATPDLGPTVTAEGLRRYIHEQLGFLAGDDDNKPAEKLLRIAAQRLKPSPLEPTPVPAPAPDQASAPRAGSAVAGGGSERPSDCCMSAGCKEPAISNSVFCQKHYDALPDLMRAEKAECALCADGVNSFTDPATGNRMHARNGVVAACTAQNGKGEQK